MRFFNRSGTRIYYALIDGVVLLLGGDKDSQTRDIRKAKAILKEYKNEKI